MEIKILRASPSRRSWQGGGCASPQGRRERRERRREDSFAHTLALSRRRASRRLGARREEGVMSRTNAKWYAVILILMSAASTLASSPVFGDARGIVLDPQQQAIKGARVTISALASDFTRTAVTNDDGEFTFRSIPLGEYTITVEHAGFAKVQEAVTITTGNTPELRFQLPVAAVSERINVIAD